MAAIYSYQKIRIAGWFGDIPSSSIQCIFFPAASYGALAGIWRLAHVPFAVFFPTQPHSGHDAGALYVWNRRTKKLVFPTHARLL
jgi:hypothetical protein